MTAVPLPACADLDPLCRDEGAGLGALRTPQGNLPLKLLDVAAHVVGLVAETRVRQTFVNTFGVPLEATYIFPLPDRAAVSSFRLEVGERVIEGALRERGAARREYDAALASGHRAAIAEEERPGVFTLRVGNLMPGEEASVHLVLEGPLPYEAGALTYRFPLVVAPRYIPGAPLDGPQVGDGAALDSDAVPDASRISPPVLLPGFPSPVRLSLTVELDPAGLLLGPVRSSLHAVREQRAGGVVLVALQPGERLDRDFVLRFALGGERPGSTLEVAADPDGAGGTFQLTLIPPAREANATRPRDVAVVLDRSGSMEGWKMVAARRATARLIDALTPRDRFLLLAFDDRVERPSLVGYEATDRNRFGAVTYLGGLEARGGTELAQPLAEAVRWLHAGERADRERVLVLVTDGQVGNEDQLLRTIGGSLGDVRVFTLGVDRAVNEGFLRRLAALGGGSCALVESEDRLDEVMADVHRRIGTPLLTSLALEAAPGAAQLEPGSLAPSRLSDLLAGAPVRVLGRFAGPAEALRLRVRGTDDAGLPYDEALTPRASSAPLLRVWGRERVRDLEDRYAIAPSPARAAEITRVSLRCGVLCRFTAFVAVDGAEVVNAGGELHRVTQAVEQPSGWATLVQQPITPPPGAFLGALPFGAAPAAFAPPPRGGDPFASGAGVPFALHSQAAFDPPEDPFAAPEAADAAARRAAWKEAEAEVGPPTGSDPFAPAPGFLHDPFGGGLAAAAAFAPEPEPFAPPPPGDVLDAYRRRAADLLDRLGEQPDARALARLALGLEALLVDLRSVGAPAAALDPLERLLEALAPARRGEPLDAPALGALHAHARAALEELARARPSAPRERHDAFWI